MTKTPLLAALALAAAPAALAQDTAGGLSVADAREFLDTVAGEAQSAADAGDWQGIATWMAEHVAEDAPVQIDGEFVTSGGPSGTYRMSLSGADLVDYAQMTAMHANATEMGDMLSDFRLETRVDGAWQVPTDKVSVAVTFYETGQIDPALGALGGVFSSMTECAMRLGGTADDVVIEVATCNVNSMF